MDGETVGLIWFLMLMIPQDKNWQAYRRLQETLKLKLRRQILVAVCDDSSLCHALVSQLEMEFRCNGTSLESGFPAWVTLEVEVQDPNLVHQIDHWCDSIQLQNPEWVLSLPPSASRHPRRRKDDWVKVSPLDLSPELPRESLPGFQFFGVERLTRQPPTQQWAFLKNLDYIAQRYLDLAWEWSLLIWVPRPWLLAIQQSVPKFWHCHTGLFEFVAEPIPSDFVRVQGLSDGLEKGEGTGELVESREEPKVPLERVQKVNPRKLETVAEIEEAIATQNQVLNSLESDDLSRLDALNDLGNLYWMLSRKAGNREAALVALQQGIQTYELALDHPQVQSQPQGYARLYNNLGIAYGELARYQVPVESIKRAIAAYQQALSYRQSSLGAAEIQEGHQYASTQNNLGTAYWNLAQHEQPVDHLKQAITAYQEALKYYNPERDALSYGMIQNNLGTAYWHLSQHEHSQDYLKLSIWSYQLALQYRTLRDNPTGYAATQNNLGTTYWHLANQSDLSLEQKRDNLQHCITAYQQAIAAIQQLPSQESLALSFDRLTTHNNLGLAFYQLAMVMRQASSPTASVIETLELSLKHHIQAWQGWQNQPEMAAIALNYLLQTLRALYHEGGGEVQNHALTQVPRNLLPEILRRL